MKFIVSRKNVSLMENKRPCDEAREEELTPLDIRTVKSLKDAKSKVWYKDWMAGGTNHREEGGMVLCDKKTKEKKWAVELATLNDLLDFQAKYGDIVITDSSPYREVSKEIKILAH